MTQIIIENVKMNSTFQVLEGMRILLKYEPRCLIDVVEDRLYFGYTNDLISISYEDKLLLEELDWFVDEGKNRWTRYI